MRTDAGSSDGEVPEHMGNVRDGTNSATGVKQKQMFKQ